MYSRSPLLQALLEKGTVRCSGTLSDNYVTYRIVSKNRLKSVKKESTCCRRSQIRVYCYACWTSINLSSVVLTCLEPCPGPATAGGDLGRVVFLIMAYLGRLRKYTFFRATDI